MAICSGGYGLADRSKKTEESYKKSYRYKNHSGTICTSTARLVTARRQRSQSADEAPGEEVHFWRGGSFLVRLVRRFVSTENARFWRRGSLLATRHTSTDKTHFFQQDSLLPTRLSSTLFSLLQAIAWAGGSYYEARKIRI